MKKYISFLILTIITISFLIAIWDKPTFNFVTFWNSIFACSLGLTVIGASLYILSSNFLQTYIRQFKRVFSQFSKSGKLADQLEKRTDSSYSFFFEIPLTTAFTITGIVLTIISGIVSIIIS